MPRHKLKLETMLTMDVPLTFLAVLLNTNCPRLYNWKKRGIIRTYEGRDGRLMVGKEEVMRLVREGWIEVVG